MVGEVVSFVVDYGAVVQGVEFRAYENVVQGGSSVFGELTEIVECPIGSGCLSGSGACVV